MKNEPFRIISIKFIQQDENNRIAYEIELNKPINAFHVQYIEQGLRKGDMLEDIVKHLNS